MSKRQIPRRHAFWIALSLTLGLGGCAGGARIAAYREQQVARVMEEWAEGWKAKDSSRLAPLLHPDYLGALRDSRRSVLAFVQDTNHEPGTEFNFSIGEIGIEIRGNHATVSNVTIDGKLETGWVSHTVMDYTLLRCDDGKWRITGSEWVVEEPGEPSS